MNTLNKNQRRVVRRPVQGNSSYVTKAQVKQLMFGLAEPKVYSTQNNGITITTSGVIANITNSIIEGDDVANRSGTKITLRNLNYRFRFAMNTSDQTARFILFRDLQNNGTTPTVTEVLPTATYLSHYSDVRYQQQHRFQILVDRFIDVSITGPSVQTIQGTVTKRMPVYYNGPTAVATANGKGALFMLVIGSNITGVYDFDIQVVYNDS